MSHVLQIGLDREHVAAAAVVAGLFVKVQEPTVARALPAAPAVTSQIER